MLKKRKMAPIEPNNIYRSINKKDLYIQLILNGYCSEIKEDDQGYYFSVTFKKMLFCRFLRYFSGKYVESRYFKNEEDLFNFTSKYGCDIFQTLWFKLYRVKLSRSCLLKIKLIDKYF